MPLQSVTRDHAARRRAVFLDQHGTLLEGTVDELSPPSPGLLPHAVAALQRLAAAGWLLVVVTHQPVLASEVAGSALAGETLPVMRKALAEQVQHATGTALAGVYVCPHGPGEARLRCSCRMPGTGLFEVAAQELGIDLRSSWMIGGVLDDVEAGHRAGCRTVFVDRGTETEWRLSPLRIPDHSCGDLLQAVALILDPPAGEAAAAAA